MCTSLSVACGMLLDLKNVKVEKDQMKTEGMKRHIVPTDKKVQKVWSKEDPVVLPQQQSDRDIKASTNFRSEKEMIAFIIIICNADWEKMTTSVTGIMTWFEEWSFFFEYI